MEERTVKQTIKYGKARIARIYGSAGVKEGTGSLVHTMESRSFGGAFAIRAGVVRVKSL